MRQRPFISPGETNQSAAVISQMRGYFPARNLPFPFFARNFMLVIRRQTF